MAIEELPDAANSDELSTREEEDELLTREGAADFLTVKPQTLAVWHSTGRYDLPVVKVGAAVRYRRRDLVAWLNSRTQVCSD